MRRLLVAALVTLISCASGRGGMSDRELLGQGPVVNPMPGAAAEEEAGGADRAEAERRLAAAREAYLRGEYGLCLTLSRRALEESPPHDIASELRSLRFEAKRRQIERSVVSGRVLADRDVYAMGDEVALRLTVMNSSDQPVRIVHRQKGSSNALVVLSVDREDRDVYGNVRSETTTETIPLERDLDLPVGGRSEVEHAVGTPPADERHLGFTVLRISATLRPSVILCGEERYYTAVEFVAAEVRIFPPGYEPIAEDPLGTLDKAYRLGAREHLLVAAELSPPERRGEVLQRLISYLEGSRTGTWVTVMAALRRLTGREFDGRAAAWVAWWNEEGRHEAY